MYEHLLYGKDVITLYTLSISVYNNNSIILALQMRKLKLEEVKKARAV